MMKLILWYLKRKGYEYTIETRTHTYINYPNTKFAIEPKENLIIYNNAPNVVAQDTKIAIECPEHKLEIKI